MVTSGPKAEMQFRYWDLKRKGATQSQIAREFGISRQAVNKSIKIHEKAVMYRILEAVQTAGGIVEWSDASRGILIGLTPQLGDLQYLIILDPLNRVRMFYDQSSNADREIARSTMEELRSTLSSSLGINIKGEVAFRTILRIVYEE